MVRARALLPHLLFWLLLLNVTVMYSVVEKNQGALTLSRYLAEFAQLETYVDLGRVMLTIYFSLWLFTHYLSSRQLPVILLQVALLGLFDVGLRYVIDLHLLGPLTGHWAVPPGTSFLAFMRRNLLTSWLFVLLAFVFKHFQDHRRAEALLHEKNAMELAYLRAQLNPHFLFNSLNNLYGLALSEPERTPDAILKLAELMRYVLYESNAERVSLAQEVNYLHSYIALEKLRHEGGVYIDFTVEGDAEGVQIAPLLLICFVENAFKHGTVSNPAQPVQLHLAIRNRHVSFHTRNQIVAKNKDLTSGVGLPTVRRRLALLYPHCHQLTISGDHGHFDCALELEALPLAAAA